MRPPAIVTQLARLQFPTCKLIDKLAGPWQHDHSLPVQVARAQIEALRTAGDPERRYRAKWQLVRNLYNLGYNADEVREIFLFIDWMMGLREDLSHRFEQEVTDLEGSLNMAYVTSVERIAEARGEARLLREQLVRSCGPLPENDSRFPSIPLGDSPVFHSLAAVASALTKA